MAEFLKTDEAFLVMTRWAWVVGKQRNDDGKMPWSNAPEMKVNNPVVPLRFQQSFDFFSEADMGIHI